MKTAPTPPASPGPPAASPVQNLSGLGFPALSTALALRLPAISVTRSVDVVPQAQSPPATPGGASTGQRALNTPASARKRHYCPVVGCTFDADRACRIERHLRNDHKAVPEVTAISVIGHLQGQLHGLVPYQVSDEEEEEDHLEAEVLTTDHVEADIVTVGQFDYDPEVLADKSNEAITALLYQADGHTQASEAPAYLPTSSYRQTARKSTGSRPPFKAEPADQ